jgi:hypothetical protein
VPDLSDKDATPSHKTLIFRHSDVPYTDIPKRFQELLDCSPMKKEQRYYWWRAITATYLLRPNAATLAELRKYRTLPLGPEYTADKAQTVSSSSSSSVSTGRRESAALNSNFSLSTSTMLPPSSKFVSIHVRHGDKSVEMKLLPFEDYADVAEKMWLAGLVQNNRKNYHKLTVSASSPISLISGYSGRGSSSSNSNNNINNSTGTNSGNGGGGGGGVIFLSTGKLRSLFYLYQY